jgi:hypothetical protein
MNWLKKKAIDWAMRQQERKKVELRYRGESLEPMTSSGRSDPLGNCGQLRFTIINVDNGTLVRMETHRPEDEYTVRAGPRRGPPTFVVKDNENVQDVIVRLLGIAALERS